MRKTRRGQYSKSEGHPSDECGRTLRCVFVDEPDVNAQPSRRRLAKAEAKLTVRATLPMVANGNTIAPPSPSIETVMKDAGSAAQARNGHRNGSPNRGPADRSFVWAKIVHSRQEYRLSQKSRLDCVRSSWRKRVGGADFVAWVGATNGTRLRLWRAAASTRFAGETTASRMRLVLNLVPFVGATCARRAHCVSCLGRFHPGAQRQSGTLRRRSRGSGLPGAAIVGADHGRPVFGGQFGCI